MNNLDRLAHLQTRWPSATMADIEELDADSMREPEPHWDDKADDFAPETRHARDCAYVIAYGPAPCTCPAGANLADRRPKK